MMMMMMMMMTMMMVYFYLDDLRTALSHQKSKTNTLKSGSCYGPIWEGALKGLPPQAFGTQLRIEPQLQAVPHHVFLDTF